MDKLLEKIKTVKDNEIQLDLLERQQRKKYLAAQNAFEQTKKEKKVNRDDLQMLKQKRNLEKQCVNAVVQALKELENKKYSEQSPEATVRYPIEEVLIHTRDKEPFDRSFVEFPQSITLEKGEKAKFRCKISGSTPMTEFSLEIPVLLPTDKGEYTVIISNDKEQITAAYSLNVDQS